MGEDYTVFGAFNRQLALILIAVFSCGAVFGQVEERSPMLKQEPVDSVTYFLPLSEAHLLSTRTGLGGITVDHLSKSETASWFRDVYAYNDNGLAYIHRKASSGLDIFLYGQQLEFGVNHKTQEFIDRAEAKDTMEVTVYNFSNEPQTFSVADNILDYFCCIQGSITLPPHSDSVLTLFFTVNQGRFVRELYFFGEDFVAVEEVHSGGYHLSTVDFNHPERQIEVPRSFYYYHTNSATELEVRDPISHELLLTYTLHKPWTKVNLKNINANRVFLILAPPSVTGNAQQQQALMVNLAD